jgi:hypothetical protein
LEKGERERVMWRNLAEAVRELQRTFEDAFDPYRPELHYMRGPGPKWRAKRSGTVAATVRELPIIADAR